MILYFTSTGNSKFVAEILKLYLQDTAVSLNHIFKNNLKLEFYTETPYVIVCPIYAWRLPRKIETFLKKAHFNGSQSIYIVATMGDSYGLADQYCKKIFLKRKMDYKGFAGILMPDNYMVSNKMLSKNEAISKIQSNLPYLHEISKHILNRSELEMKLSSKKMLGCYQVLRIGDLIHLCVTVVRLKSIILHVYNAKNVYEYVQRIIFV